MAELTIPPLTSMHMSRPELAGAAVSSLRAHIESLSPRHEYEIATHLVVRESTSVRRSTTVHSRNRKIEHATPARVGRKRAQ
jgi:LacI family transcriptional regulator